jgi:translation initiation factor IF-2
MSDRIRVYELANELGLGSKELIELLAEEGLEVKSHSSSIDEEFAALVRDHVITERRLAQEEREERLEAALNASARAAATGKAEEVSEEDEEEEDEELDAVDEAAKEVHLKPPVIVRDLAEALKCKPNEIIGELMLMNVFATINQTVEPEIVQKLCQKRGYTFVPEKRAKKKAGKKAAKKAAQKGKAPAKKVTQGESGRPPIVAFLGHVDHGKTSLLDAIRDTHVTRGEAGGITQHIGASEIEWQDHVITLLDTPGHEAFTAMRARGANATDIVVLVVAADDGIMPQTIEAINHSRAAGVPIVVAMNKIDLTDANPDQVLLGLQQQEVTPEEWGGEVGVVPVSAITGQGLDDLLERIILESELLELKASPSGPGEGIVIEAQLEQGMGPTANVLVTNGTLSVGDVVLCGENYGKVKALIDQHGQRVRSAGPSKPVKLLGLDGVPSAGDSFVTYEDEREARAVAEQRISEKRLGELDNTRKASLESLFEQMTEEARKDLNLIIKADVQGSIEAISDNLDKLPSDKVELKIIHSAVGEVTENDVLLASASDAILVGFHVRATNSVNKLAKREGVQIRLYSVIYELLADIKEAMVGQLEPELREKRIGRAEIREVFEVSKAGKICGCYVGDGVTRVGASARVLRDDDIIYNGQIQSLRRFKDDVREVRQGMECGIRLDNFEDFEVGDMIEVFTVERVAAKL